MEYPLSNEKAFIKHLEKLSCNGCKFFIGSKCTSVNSEENENNKSFLIGYHNKIAKPFNIEWAKNIDKHFICNDYEGFNPTT